MKFKKKVLFLSCISHPLQDGSSYYSLSFFSHDDGPIEVTVGERHPCVAAMSQAKFGDQMDVTFELRPKDKLYKLTLAY